MKKLNASNNNRKTLLHNIYLARAATIFALAVVFASTTTTISPVSATTTGNTSAAASSPALELSAQPVWDEQATSTSVTQINETHRIATFIGNGTMTVPDTGETINMTNNGTAFISFVPGYNETVSTYGSGKVGYQYHLLLRQVWKKALLLLQEIQLQLLDAFDANATGTSAGEHQ